MLQPTQYNKSWNYFCFIFFLVASVFIFDFYYVNQLKFSRNNFDLTELQTKQQHTGNTINDFVNEEIYYDFTNNLNGFENLVVNNFKQPDEEKEPIFDFVQRFKGITIAVDKNNPFLKNIIFDGKLDTFLYLKSQLFSFNYEMIFGDIVDYGEAFKMHPLDIFVDMFNGITVKDAEDNCKIIEFIGSASQLKFIKQKLKERNYKMIFGELKDE